MDGVTTHDRNVGGGIFVSGHSHLQERVFHRGGRYDARRITRRVTKGAIVSDLPVETSVVTVPAAIGTPAGNTPEAVVQRERTAVDVLLVLIVTLLMGFLAYLTLASLRAQILGYERTFTAAIEWNEPYALLSYVRARDHAMLKSATVFMGFILIFVGCLYVLRTASVPFRLTTGRSTLLTTSPGLVMVTLGVLLVVLALRWTANISFDSSHRPAASQTVPATATITPARVEPGFGAP